MTSMRVGSSHATPGCRRSDSESTGQHRRATPRRYRFWPCWRQGRMARPGGSAARNAPAPRIRAWSKFTEAAWRAAKEESHG